MLRTLLFLSLSSGLLPGADDGCAALRESKGSTYGFSPASLSKLEKTAKIQALDRFWKLAKADPQQSAPCLRVLLENERGDPFFSFDGSQLLFSLDKSLQSAEAIARALARVDLNDIKSYDYVALAIEASKAGADIGAAAMNFARARNVDDYAAGVGVRMSREHGIIALLGRLPVEDAVVKGKALYQSGDPVAAPYGLLVLALALTPDALAVVLQAGDIAALPVKVRRQISALLSRNSLRPGPPPVYRREQLLGILKSAPNYPAGVRGPSGNEDFLASAFAELEAGDAAAVRDARRRSMADPSNGSLLQYYGYTHILHVVETKANLLESAAVPAAKPADAATPKTETKTRRN